MTTSPKLTPAQLAVLRELCKPGGKAHFMSGGDAYWFLSGNYKHCTRQMFVLIERGLVDVKIKIFNIPDSAKVNDKGRALLSEIDKENKPDA